VDDPRIAAAETAVECSAAVRRSVARKEDGDRDDRLQEALEVLSGAMEPIRDELVRAPRSAPSLYRPDLRAASKRLQSERGLVRSMLNRRHGGRTRRQPPRVDRLLRSTTGTVRQAKGEVQRLASELDEVRRARGVLRGYPALPPLLWHREVTLAAREIKTDAQAVRKRIVDAEQRLWTSPAIKFPGHERSRDKLSDEIDMLRMEFGRIAAAAKRIEKARPPRKRPPAREKPARRKYVRWTVDSARAALAAWEEQHGRVPTARDLTDRNLPSYGTVHRLLGGLPSSTLTVDA
jgi:hypothetical protein